MKIDYAFDFTLAKNTVPATEKHKSHHVLERASLEINDYLFEVTLDQEMVSKINASDFDDLKYRYHYRLCRGADLVASGKVRSCQNMPTTNGRRIFSLDHVGGLINEIMHEAIGSMILSDVAAYTPELEQLKFFEQVSAATSFTAGVNNSGAIGTPRFVMAVSTDIPHLRGGRRFSISRDGGIQRITGVTTTWVYNLGDQTAPGDEPRLLFRDRVEGENFTFTPMTDKEALVKIKAYAKALSA
ncbi:hypothetical protein pEaSNUABM37_00101 [Erwinia phage pEa_SNUABM_37]|nr:hypothetical protein pEaSNUABM37_00101 [Erwinia phage pEa_SNUABM_37]QXO10571.1 hypothetical protein pEaSNUABM48_00101 [Erwinia phage pEa_SNUABM_48]